MNGKKSWGWNSIRNATAAAMLQEYITAFVVKGSPNDGDALKNNIFEFPAYGPDAHLLDITPTDISVIRDNTANHRCDWWQRGLYY